MVYRDLTGRLVVRFSRQELIEALERWRQKHETKDMIAKFAKERRAFVDTVIAKTKENKK